MTQAVLPRVTHSNIGTDFTLLHDFLDKEIAAATARLAGRRRCNRIDGKDDAGGDVVRSCSPIDRDLILVEQIAADTGAVERAVSAARSAYTSWSHTPWSDRVSRLKRLVAVLDSRKYELGIACLLEVGKSRLEALGEAEEAIDLVRYYVAEMERSEGFERPSTQAFAREATSNVLRPMGVFAVIAPFNFPLALSVDMLTRAIITGNTAVYKPSRNAGLTGALLMQAIEEAGIPAGVVNLICGGDETGRALLAHRGIAGVAFAGSRKAGLEIFRLFASCNLVRPVIARMGGKNPAYVTASADIDIAAQGVLHSAFGMSGQNCNACSKVYVHASLRAQFMQRLVEGTQKIQLGDVRNRETYMGPVIDEWAAARFADAVLEARRDGYVICGGERLTGGFLDRGAYVAPSIATALAAQHRLNKDELLLPFLSVIEFGRLEDAIKDGNPIDYGLTASCYTRDDRELQIFLDTTEAGVVDVNSASGPTTNAWSRLQNSCRWKGSGIAGKGRLGPDYLSQFMHEQSRTVLGWS